MRRGFDGGDANLYRYVGSGPLNAVDPTGLIQAGNPLTNLNLFAGAYTGGAVLPFKPGNQFVNSTNLFSSPTSIPNFNAGLGLPNYYASQPNLSGGISSYLATPAPSTIGASTLSSGIGSLANPGPLSAGTARFTDPSLRDIRSAQDLAVLRNVQQIYVGADLGSRINDPLITLTSNILANPRVQGGLQVATGAGQLVGAAAATSVPFVGPAITLLVGARGVDNVTTGFSQLVTGRHQDTKLATALTSLQTSTFGVQPGTAQNFARFTESAFDILTVFTGAAPGPRAPRPPVTSGPTRILVEQPRDALGRFLPRTGGEVRPGSLAEQATFDAVLQKPGWDVIRNPVYVRDATGQLRVYDGAAISPSGRYIGLETKSGTGRLTPDQRAFDTRLNSSRANTALGVGQSSQYEIQRAVEVRR